MDLHTALKTIATSTVNDGFPAVIHLQSRVIGADLEDPSIILHDRTRVAGDLILGGGWCPCELSRDLREKPLLMASSPSFEVM